MNGTNPKASISNAEAIRELYAYGLERKKGVFLVTGVMLYLMMLLGTVGLISVWFHLSASRNVSIEAFLGIGVAFAGIYQWRSSKYEMSIDRFYERLSYTNTKLFEWESSRVLLSEEWVDEKVFQREMYVYLELDNLEYIIQKYQHGFMEPHDAHRALTCFSSRCKNSPAFKALAIENVSKAGYKPETSCAIRRLCQDCYRNTGGEMNAGG